jgi:hypothetical protein
MTNAEAREYAQLYDVSTRTIRRWQAEDLPLDDYGKMRDIILAKRSRWGVSKYMHRAPRDAGRRINEAALYDKLTKIALLADDMLTELERVGVKGGETTRIAI